MDTPPLLSPRPPRLVLARSPSPSPTRQRIADDLLSDLSPASTLDAFTSPSGKLRASIEAADPDERAFGIRATLASKKIQEWVDELSKWPWPAGSGSAGFETPAPEKRRVIESPTTTRNGLRASRDEDQETYMGSLPAHDVIQYGTRVDEIQEDMEDLNVEEIKSKVLDTFSPRSRPSSSHSGQSTLPMPSLFTSYTKMEDFTAVVTATVLQALPNLSRLMRLMDVWGIRLAVLRKVPPLLESMDDTELALKSGWQTIERFDCTLFSNLDIKEDDVLSRETFDIMRNVLQDKVTTLGRDLDFMLDTLEGRQDTLPDSWLDRMEAIELDYGEWVVSGDRKVREGEWARNVRARKLAEEERRIREAEEAAARKKLEDERRAREEAEVTARKQAEDEQRAREEQELDEWERQEDERLARLAADAAARKQLEDERLTKEAEEAAAARKDAEHEKTAEEVEASAIPETEYRGETSTKADHPKEAAPEDTPASMMPAVIGAVAGTMADMAAGLGLSTRYTESSKSDHAVDPDQASNPEDVESIDGPSDAQSTGVTDQRSIAVTPGTLDKSFDTENSTLKDCADGTGEIELPTTPKSHKSPVIAQGEHSDFPHTPMASPASTIKSIPSSKYQVEESKPVTPSEVPRFGHPMANSLRRSMSRQLSDEQESFKSTRSPSKAHSQNVVPLHERIEQQPLHLSLRDSIPDQSPHQNGISKPNLPDKDQTRDQTSDAQSKVATIVQGLESKQISSTSPIPDTKHSRKTSTPSSIFAYSSSFPTPEVYEAEPAEYFRPVLSPIKSPDREFFESSTPTKILMRDPDDVLPSIEMPSPEPEFAGDIDDVTQIDGAYMSRPEERKKSEHDMNDFSQHSFNSFASSPQIRIRHTSSESRRESISSDASTIMTGRPGSSTTSPMKNSYDDSIASSSIASSPTSDVGILQNYSEVEEQSPSAGRYGLRRGFTRSPSGSPPPLPRLPLHLMDSPHFSQSSEPEDRSADAPFLHSVDISTASALPSPTTGSGSDDQLQQQITALLESIPAHIRLNTEPDPSPPVTYAVRSKKSRPSLAPSYSRPHSSMSNSRSPTPFLTLAPAYARNPRPRPSNGNPDIKVYHLSRSTGEAPIKLFVRLVGEHGERVMVRVGGGWADLGEYLKEYAAHHSRRASGIDPDNLGKVEIQDLPPRMVSSSSISSMRSGRDTPVPRSTSAMDRERPRSSLGVRKPRKSFGADPHSSSRTPSTPLPQSRTQHGTPPSEHSASRLSWTPDEEAEKSLGLAGPRGTRKESDLSAQDKDWVEGMKEKVRQASAEKERRMKMQEKEKKFGDLDKAGGTRRLFPKGKGVNSS